MRRGGMKSADSWVNSPDFRFSAASVPRTECLPEAELFQRLVRIALDIKTARTAGADIHVRACTAGARLDQ